MILLVVVLLLLTSLAWYFWPHGPKYLGCYTDSDNRVLPVALGSNIPLSECEARARQGGYKYYGGEHVSGYSGDNIECWGGNSLVSQGLATNCRKNAAGQMVGDNWSLGVHQF